MLWAYEFITFLDQTEHYYQLPLALARYNCIHQTTRLIKLSELWLVCVRNQITPTTHVQSNDTIIVDEDPPHCPSVQRKHNHFPLNEDLQLVFEQQG